MNCKHYSLLALLFVGSAGLQAQTDPFPDVDDSEYSNNMTLTGYVRLDGAVLGQDAVVAVYDGDVIRGKASPTDTDHNTDILFITICGELDGQALHFKVFTGGRVLETDQGLTYANDVAAGSIGKPYYIDLTSPVVTQPDDEGWATACLPYDAQVPEGVTVYNVTGISNGEVQWELLEGNIIAAGVPVLLQSTSSDSFEWLPRVTGADIPATETILLGTTADTPVEPGTVLTLGYSDEDPARLGFWQTDATVVPANSAYIADFADEDLQMEVPGAIINTEEPPLPTSVGRPTAMHVPHACFDLQGRKVSNRQMKGIYICGGRKVVR